MQTQTLHPPASFHPISERWRRRETASVPRPGRALHKPRRARCVRAHVCVRFPGSDPYADAQQPYRKANAPNLRMRSATRARRGGTLARSHLLGKNKNNRRVENQYLSTALAVSGAPVSAGAEAVARQDRQDWSRFRLDRTGFADCSTVYRLVSERRRGERRTPHANQYAR